MTEAERCYRAIQKGNDVRQNLIDLRKAMTDQAQCRAFVYFLGGDFKVFTGLLKNEDPKVRRSAALILGMMETEDVLPFLFAAWEKEETRFVRPAYLKAMDGLDIRPYLGKLKARVRRLENETVDENTGKHVREELSALHVLLLPYENMPSHQFAALKVPEVLLMTRRCVAADTAELIHEGQVCVKGGIIHVTDANVQELLQIRTWQEMLMPVPGAGTLRGDAPAIGRALAHLGIDAFLDRLHEGDGAWRYRLEMRPAAGKSIDSRFLHTICGELDRESAGSFVNAPDAYEAEIRLIGRMDGSWLPLIKCTRLPDVRFRYRREYTAQSMTPVTAAIVMRLAAPWLKEGAAVLDPFCGVGTLLTERCYAGQTGTVFGTDIYADAIEKARMNAAHAKLPIHYIHRDFFTFRSDRLFDEVIADLPRSVVREDGTQVSTREIAVSMLQRLSGMIGEGAVVVVYSLDAQAVRDALHRDGRYRIERFEVISEKSGASVYVCRFLRS